MQHGLRSLQRLWLLVHWRTWQGRAVIWGGALLAALLIVGFAMLVEHAIALFEQARQASPWLPLLLTPAGGMLIVWLTRRFFAGAEGSGIPQVMAALHHHHDQAHVGKLVSLRIAVGKVLLGVLGLGVGAWLPTRFPVRPYDLILAGGAAGIAAAFNTPLAGIVFAIEELGRKFEARTNGVLLSAIILAGIIAIALQGNYTYFGRISIPVADSRLALPILLSGVICGLAGGMFSRAMLAGMRPWPGWPGWLRSRHPVWFAGACGLLVAVLGYVSDGAAHGSGYGATQQALTGTLPLAPFYALEKMLATLLSYFSGIPGGVFAPSLAIGAGVGQDLANLGLGQVSSSTWIALSMAAFLAAVTQAPITAFVIVMEMIDGHALVVSLIASAFLASLVYLPPRDASGRGPPA